MQDAPDIGLITWKRAQALIPLFVKRGVPVHFENALHSSPALGYIALRLPMPLDVANDLEALMWRVTPDVLAEEESIERAIERCMAL